ncbi:MAG: flavodoxin [Bacteroidales bacterium]|nr:flavodoxin [Bacteroidales bacterium]
MKKLLLICLTTIALQANAQTLVAFFSATGTTKQVAQDLARVGEFDLWEIVAYQPYTEADLDWRNKQSRSSIEMADTNERPTILMCTDIRSYDTIYLGFPIWWDICPRIIQSWIDNNDLTGKTLIPFATSGGGSIQHAVEFLRKTYPQYTWLDGQLLNDYSDATLKEWIKK